jgi:penicillin-binding protein 1A
MARSLGEKETGSRAASPIWLGFMKQVLANEPVRQFQVPTGVVFARGECFKEGKVPREDTGNSDEIAWSSAPDGTGIPRKSERTQRGTVTGMDQFFKSTM